MASREQSASVPGVRLAVSSFMPGSPYWEPMWPASGPITREAAFAKLPKPELITVLELPVVDPGHLHFQAGACWVVLEIEAAEFESNEGEVQFKQGVVVFNGPACDARTYIASRGVRPPSSINAVLDIGDWAAAEAGKNVVAVAGYEATVSAGENSVVYVRSGEARAHERSFAISEFGSVRAGDHGIAVTRYGVRAEAGDFGLAVADEFSEAVAGDCGVALADTGATSISGSSGISIGRLGGAAVAGEQGIALAAMERGGSGAQATVGRAGIAIGTDYGCSAQAGIDGVLILMHFGDPKYPTGKVCVAYVGQDGIKPNTPYRLDDDGRFVEVADE